MALPPPETQSKPFPQRWQIAAVFAALVVLLVAWYFLALRQVYVTLYEDLRPSEASAVVAELDEQGVRYKLREGGGQILVPSSQLDAVRLQLASPGVSLNGLDGFELFNESDMGLTDFAQKIRYQRALQGELARTIMMMEGVADARVHISMPERTVFRGERRNAEAAVTLAMQSPADETPARIEGVQRLVAASVGDLAVADVVVLNARGEVISPRPAPENQNRALQGVVPDPSTPSLSLVMEIVRQALPNRRFEVSIEQAPPTLAGPADADGSVGVGRQTPRHVVSLVTETPLDAEEAERLAGELRRAHVIDNASGGTLSLRVGPPTMFAGLAGPVVSAQADTRGAKGPSAPTSLFGFGALTWIAISTLALLAGIALGLKYWFGRPSLPFEDHKRLAERLKAGLRPRTQGGQSV